MQFEDRRTAGRQLGARLVELGFGAEEVAVLALPRGGVPVAFEVAERLDAGLDVLVARKLGAPMQPELGVGAIAEGGVEVIDPRTTSALGIGPSDLADVVEREREELRRRVERYRGGRPLPALDGRTVVVVDDGLATGVTAQAALRAARTFRPARLVLAAPVCAGPTVRRLADEADDIVCLAAPEEFLAVGYWYRVFDQTSDDEVLDLLGRARERVAVGGAGDG